MIGMIKNGARYRDIYNYRNSRHFIQTVKEARRYDEKHGRNLVILLFAPPFSQNLIHPKTVYKTFIKFAQSPVRLK